MNLIINSFGTYITKAQDCFLLKNKEKTLEVSHKKVEQILIATGASISTDAIKLAIDNNIDIVFLDKYGNPYSRIWHSKLGSTTLIRRRQLEFALDKRGTELAKEFILTKFNNSIAFLKKLQQYRKDNFSFEKTIKIIENEKIKINSLSGSLDEIRNQILGYEGTVSAEYFHLISSLLPQKYRFKKRTRMPAEDPFNAMLNYGYGILYSMVEKACIIAGLDPYIGFIHTDFYNKKSLVFDVIELYRMYVDKIVVYQFTQKKINDSYFDVIKNGYTLNKEGKEFFINVFDAYFEKKIRYKNRNIQLKNIIQYDMHNLAQKLLKSDK